MVLLSDGAMFSIGETGERAVVQTAIGPRRFVRYAHIDDVTAMAVSPDGQWIVTAGPGARVHVWDAISGDRVRVGGPARWLAKWVKSSWRRRAR